MITLLDHGQGSFTSRVTVLLDLDAENFNSPPAELQHLFTQAKENKRMVGLIEREVGGDTFFTYAPGNQMQLEVALISALAVPKPNIYVDSYKGGYENV
jgi:hypothetical protein